MLIVDIFKHLTIKIEGNVFLPLCMGETIHPWIFHPDPITATTSSFGLYAIYRLESVYNKIT